MQSLTSPLVQLAGTLASTLGLGVAGIDLLTSAFGVGVALGVTAILALLLTFGWGILVGVFLLRQWQRKVDS